MPRLAHQRRQMIVQGNDGQEDVFYIQGIINII